MAWSFHLQHFVEGKGLGGFLDGTTAQPTDDAKFAATWSQNNSKVVTWILNSSESNISSSLQAFKKASDMWDHLKKLYHQANKARQFHLETELVKYGQGDKTVQDYYNGYLTLWNEIDSMILIDVPREANSFVIKIQKNAHISQFLMNLRPEFEYVRAALLNREVPPNLDTCVQEVLREESRLQSQNHINEEPKAFLNPTIETLALKTTQGLQVQCFECKSFWACCEAL
eukprot:TRINITY_DN4622_c0_g1_i1.p1 TRINITY_DN4622_c0_g1~~TRINITY_DN4622_c0_g1_i1.p1  ORF type:complete len:229 (+),score=31.44 TRINITY_DN4622_c0_g1_i1:829-1515(+)